MYYWSLTSLQCVWITAGLGKYCSWIENWELRIENWKDYGICCFFTTTETTRTTGSVQHALSWADAKRTPCPSGRDPINLVEMGQRGHFIPCPNRNIHTSLIRRVLFTVKQRGKTTPFSCGLPLRFYAMTLSFQPYVCCSHAFTSTVEASPVIFSVRCPVWYRMSVLCARGVN